MARDDKHVSIGWNTACGLSIHGSLLTIPIAASLRAVTCPECRATKFYRHHLSELERELSAMLRNADASASKATTQNSEG